MSEFHMLVTDKLREREREREGERERERENECLPFRVIYTKLTE